MKQSIHGDDPISQEILFFKKQREEADRIEQVFRQVKQVYSGSGIEAAKSRLLSTFLHEEGIYNKKNADSFYLNLKQSFGNLILTSSSLRNHEIIARHQDHQLQRVEHRPTPQPTYVPQKDNRPSIETSFSHLSANYSQSYPPKAPESYFPIPEPKEESMALQAGQKSLAKLSPDRSEIQITTAVDHLKLERVKSIDVSVPGTVPTALRAVDNRLVVIGFSDGALKVADVGDGCRFVRQYRFASLITAIDLQDENDKMLPLLCATAAPDCSVILLELQKKQPHVVRFKHSADVTTVVSLAPLKFATGTSKGDIHLWNKNDPNSSISVKAHTSKITAMTTLSGGKTLLSASDDSTVKVFDVSEGQLIVKSTIQESRPVTLVSSFHGNTKFAVFALMGGSLRVWNVADKE